MAYTKTRIQLRNDLSANWDQYNPTLLKGEFAFDSTSKYIKIGDGSTAWKDLATVRLPKSAIDDITDVNSNTIYSLSNVTTMGFTLVSADGTLETPVWSAVTSYTAKDWTSTIDTTVNTVSTLLSTDVKTNREAIATLNGDVTVTGSVDKKINDKIESLSVDQLSLDADESIKSIKEVDGKIVVEKQDIQLTGIGQVTGLETAIATAKSEAITTAQEYSNSISTALSTDYQYQIDVIKSDISSGIHYIGHVHSFGVTDTSGWYIVEEGGSKETAKNGDLIINKDKEYIWSQKQNKWDEFGDEGNYATKQFVNDAKAAAIAATTNTVQSVSAYSELSNGVNTGDVGLVRSEIGTTGKYEISAYTWDAKTSAWKKMDEYFSTDNVILHENMRITKDFGKYTIDKTIGYRDLDCAGMTIKAFLHDAFADKKSSVNTLPTASLTLGSIGTGEVGSTYTVPKATFKLTGVGKYEYGPATGVTIPALSATITRATSGTTAGASAQNDSALELNGSFDLPAGTANEEVFTDNDKTYSYTVVARYSNGATPKNNLGEDDPTNNIKSAEFAANKSGITIATTTATGYRKTFYYVGTDSSTEMGSAFLRTTGSGHTSDNSVVKSKALTIPEGTKRVAYAIKGGQTLKSVIDKDGMGLDVKGNFTTTTYSVEGASDGYATNYTVFECINDAGLKATTYTFTLN